MNMVKSAEREIEALIEQCRAAAARKDHAAIGLLYASDAKFMPAHAPLATGPAAAAEIWRAMLSLPNLSLSWSPTTIDASSSGDFAYVAGSYELAFDTDAGRVEDRGKYVAVWKRIDGAWKMVADINNSDLSASAAAGSASVEAAAHARGSHI